MPTNTAALTPVQDRALGAFFGLAVGDALGTTIEFRLRDTYAPVTDMVGGGPFQLRPGEWTDDTSMALCLADSLIETKGALDPFDLADRFVRWWKQGENSVNGRCFDIGNATRAALARYRETGAPRGDDSPGSAGNGGIMRLAPAALAAYRDPERAIALSRAQLAVTHAATECLDAAEVLSRVLLAGIAGAGQEAVHAAAAGAFASPKASAIAKGGWREKSRDEIKSSGYVIDTLEAALWAVGGSQSFEEAVLRAVNLGDDADTVGRSQARSPGQSGATGRYRHPGASGWLGVTRSSSARFGSWPNRKTEAQAARLTRGAESLLPALSDIPGFAACVGLP